ncbi:MAG: hypothetical protein EOO01_08580 [Chitinophagaceae bacterium]|nr:MAG: hypothetical protein EOO01_08580 [Chitinophagaceae bacterium]
MARNKELVEVFLLRGVASLSVCLFHLVLGNADLFSPTNSLEKICSYGYLGVEVFFMVSGYVICYSLPEKFSYRNAKTFFLKLLIHMIE